MPDVIDDDLMRELGLDADDLKEIETKKKADKPEKRPVDPPAATETPKKNPIAPPAKTNPDLTTINETLAKDVPIQLAAVLAKKTMTLGQVLGIRVGEVVELGQKPTDTIDLVANGKLVAKAELVMIDGQMGVRIVKLIR